MHCASLTQDPEENPTAVEAELLIVLIKLLEDVPMTINVRQKNSIEILGYHMEVQRLSDSDDWTLHGVWPDMCAPPPVCWPQFCDKVIRKPNPFQLSQMMLQLEAGLKKNGQH